MEYNDIVSHKFGQLKVISFYDVTKHGGKRKARYLCKCSCGEEKLCLRERLLDGRNTSCGHKVTNGNKYIKGSVVIKRKYKKGKDHPRFTGHEELHGSHWSKIKAGAKSRNLEFLISLEEAWNLFLKQNRKCALSGIELKFSRTAIKKLSTASLDRIDSNKGYTLSNVQWIHKDINQMKMDLDENYFIEMCRKIANYVKT